MLKEWWPAESTHDDGWASQIWGFFSHWSSPESTCIASLPQAHSEGRFLFSSLQLAVRSTDGSPGVWKNIPKIDLPLLVLLYSNLWSNHHTGLRITSVSQPDTLHPSCHMIFHCHQSLTDLTFLLLPSTNHPKGQQFHIFIPITSVSFHFIYQST